MTQTPPVPEDFPSTVDKQRPRFSVIWIVPVLAILVGIGLAVQAIRARGPEINLQFSVAEGLEAGKTRVKFKDVAIGTVSDIALSDDQKSVRVSVQMDKQAEGLIVEDTRFWVVRPRIAAGGVSGLATLLSGVYIAMDPGKSTQESSDFVGLESPPQITSATPGRQFQLKADDLGSLDVGVPVYYRRIPVGRVASYAMQKDGKGVDVNVFIDAPYDAFVTTDTRFWHASGIDVALNSEGVKVDMQSLASLVAGGIAFATPESPGEEAAPRAPESSIFPLHQNHTAALRVPDRIVQKYLMTFNESVRGLAVGASVDYRGLTVGEVTRIDMRFSREAAQFLILVEVNLYPERFLRRVRHTDAGDAGSEQSRKVVDMMVKRGFRAQLRTASIVSGQRYIALDFFKNAKAAQVDWSHGTPELPTQSGTLDSLEDQILLIVESLRKTVGHVDALVVRMDKEVIPELTTTLGEARQTLKSADQALASDSPTQVDLRDTLREVSKAAASMRNLADMLEREPEALLRGKKGD
ncbi:MAG TPA: MlaD family protein [Rhodocyclaceae bacterium]|nr:MlaD family protein [Rhodocyclaceae bacterium]